MRDTITMLSAKISCPIAAGDHSLTAYFFACFTHKRSPSWIASCWQEDLSTNFHQKRRFHLLFSHSGTSYTRARISRPVGLAAWLKGGRTATNNLASHSVAGVHAPYASFNHRLVLFVRL